MSDSDSFSDLVLELAEEFIERCRRGERPQLAEYIAKHPQLAAEIREVFPAMAMVERIAIEDDSLERDPVTPAVPELSQIGDYRIIREVGRGGMGVVYEAEQVSLGRRVAVKVLPRTVFDNDRVRKRFARESRAAARLHHTNIVPVFGVGEQDGLQYYVMQFIQGLGLDQVLVELRRLQKTGSSMPGKVIPGKALPQEISASHRTPERQIPAHADVSADAVARSLMDGRLGATLLLPSDSRDSGGTQQADVKENRSVVASIEADSSTADQRPDHRPGLSDTVAGIQSETARSGEIPLPGQSQVSSGKAPRMPYWRSVATIGAEVANALQHAHQQGIVHRDIKPANLLMDMRGNVWVTDFGLAKASDQQDLTHTGDILGTLRYMAPEQFEGTVDHRTDTYSLGLTLYELLALRPAFMEKDRHKLMKQVTTEAPPALKTLDPGLPTDLTTIVQKAIDRDPSHRYQSAQDMADDLDRFLRDEPILARRISPVTRFVRWCKRNPMVSALTTTIAVLLIVATGVSLAAAMTFQQMASRNSQLAGDLNTALSDAQKNLAQVEEKEQIAQTNLSLATAEQLRAEGNLDLALKAMDAVYLEAIGTEKLLGEPVARLEEDGSVPRTRAPLSDLEKQLLQRGLSFYDQFAKQNAKTPRAAVQTAQAYYRVGLLQAGLGDLQTAASSYRDAIVRYEALTRQHPTNVDHWQQLAEAHSGLAWTCDTWEQAKSSLEASRTCLTAALAVDNKNVALYMRRMDVAASLNDFTGQDKDRDTILALAPNDVSVLLKATSQMLHRNWPKSLEQQSMATARELVTRAVKAEPNNALCHLGMAEVLSRTQNVIMYPHGKFRWEILEADKALTHVSRAIEIAPTLDTAYFVRSRIFQSTGHYEKALSDINAAIQLKPDDLDLVKSRGLLHFNWEKDAAAEADFHAVLAQRPLDPEACRWIAYILMNRGDYGAAIQWMQKGIASGPEYTVYKRLAEAQIRLGRYDDAVASMETALSIYPDDLSTLWAPFIGQEVPADPELRRKLIALAERSLARVSVLVQALADRGYFYSRIGDFERAERDFVEAERVDPGALELWGKWAKVATQRADFNRALAMYDKQIAITPESWNAFANRAKVNVSLGRDANALEDINRSIALHPRNPENLRFRSGVLARQGKSLEAARDIQEAMDCGVIRAIDMHQLALLSLVHKDREQYRAASRTMLAKFAESKVAEELNFTAWTAALAPQALDDYGPAIALSQHGVELNKDNPEAIRSLGAIHYRAGQFDEAAKQLTPLTAAAEKPSPEAKSSSAYPFFFLAMAQHQLGKKDEARATLQKAAELAKAELSDDEKNPPAWNRKLTLELLQKEAEGLIGPPPSAQDAPAP